MLPHGYKSRGQRLLPIPSQYTDTGPTSPSTVPIMPEVLAGKLLDCQFLSLRSDPAEDGTPDLPTSRWTSHPLSHQGRSKTEIDKKRQTQTDVNTHTCTHTHTHTHKHTHTNTHTQTHTTKQTRNTFFGRQHCLFKPCLSQARDKILVEIPCFHGDVTEVKLHPRTLVSFKVSSIPDLFHLESQKYSIIHNLKPHAPAPKLKSV